MAKANQNKKSLKYISRVRFLILAVYAVIVFLTLILFSFMSVRKSNTLLKDKVINLTSSLNIQMKLNLESYMSRMETIATLAFGEKLAYTYDATDPDNDEFEALNTEKIITDKLFSLCIMENFVDYGIVYSNNRTVGKISNGTSTLFGDTLYTELAGMIEKTEDNSTWFTGYKDSFKRIYYVKRVHENAILFISFYSDELNEVFDNPETLSDMNIYLVNQQYNILYSKQGNEVGNKLPSHIISLIDGKNDGSYMNNDYLVSVNRCEDWYVVCSIPTRIILKETTDIRNYIFLGAIFGAILAFAAGFFISTFIMKPVAGMVADLDDKANQDRLTGLLNKTAFEDLVSSCLDNTLKTEKKALLIFDIDDFKNVNDTLGHAAGDRMLREMAAVLSSVFTSDDYIGRIGGDEFCVLVNYNPAKDENYEEFIAEKCDSFINSFIDNAVSKELDYKVSASVGISLSPKDGRDFSTLYKASDKALYESKKSGKCTYTFYKGGDKK